MKKTSTNCICRIKFYCLILVIGLFSIEFVNSQTTNELQKQKTHVCGNLQYKKQPVLNCKDSSHFTNNEHNQDFEFEDRFGNRYCNSSFSAKKTTNKSHQLVIIETNHFILSFEDIGKEYRKVIGQVYWDLESFIVFGQDQACQPQKVKISIKQDKQLGENMLAVGSSHYTNKRKGGPLQHGDVWEIINTGKVSAYYDNHFDGFIKLNTKHLGELYTGFAQDLVNQNGALIPDGIMDNGISNITEPVFDLYSLVLHEALHTLGFASRLRANINVQNTLSYFDLLLLDGNSNSFINQDSPYSWTPNWSNINNLLISCGNTIKTNSNHRVPLYSTDSSGLWKQGASFSHINDSNNTCNNNNPFPVHLMSQSLSARAYERLTQDEVDILHQIGYTTKDFFGDEYLHSGSTESSNIINPNRQEFIGNTKTPIAYATGNPCEGFYYTQCLNNTPSFEFTQAVLDNIKNNDINTTENHEVGNFELQFGENGTITNNMLTINTSTYASNIVRVKYQLINKITKQASNTNYINVVVLPCEALRCSDNDSSCNLVCNSELDANLTDFGKYSMNALFLPNITLPTDAIEGWYGFDSLNVLKISNSKSTIHRPLISDDNYVLTKRRDSPNQINSYLVTNLKEGITKDQKYILSYFHSGTTTNSASNVGFFENLNTDTPYPRPIFPYTNNPNDPNYNGNFNETPLNIDHNIPKNIWEQNIIGFIIDESTSVNTYTTLYLNSQSKGGVYFDQVEIIKDNFDQVPTAATCENGTVNIGMELCSVTGMQYSWYDITGTTAIQLTQGMNITSQGLAAGIKAADIKSNGSQLQLHLEEDKVLELRRVFTPLNIENESMMLSFENTLSAPFIKTGITQTDTIEITVTSCKSEDVEEETEEDVSEDTTEDTSGDGRGGPSDGDTDETSDDESEESSDEPICSQLLPELITYITDCFITLDVELACNPNTSITYFWEFGDGITHSSSNPPQYDLSSWNGDFEIKLTIHYTIEGQERTEQVSENITNNCNIEDEEEEEEEEEENNDDTSIDKNIQEDVFGPQLPTAVVKLYPNPAIDNVTAYIEDKALKKGIVKLINTIGLTVQQARYNNSYLDNKVHFNVSTLRSGAYIVKFIDDSGIVVNGRLLIE